MPAPMPALLPTPSPTTQPLVGPLVGVPERGRVAVNLTQADRVALHELSGRLGTGTFTVMDTPGGTQLQAGPFIGLFALPSFTLRVQAKADIHPWNVLYMLHRASGRQWPLPPVAQALDYTDLQEMLAALFLHELQAQLRRGLLRKSALVQEDSPTVRGRLRVPEYLRRTDPTHLPVEYPDLTANHPVSRLFLLVLERLARRVQAGQLRRYVAELRVLLHDAGVQAWPSVPLDRRPYTLNRLQRRYAAALSLAWLLLDGWGSLPEHGRWHGQAFTFNMDRLYEQFLERVLTEDILPGTGYSAHAQGRGLGPAERYLFSDQTQELKPDLLIQRGSEVALVIDFKNKRPDRQLGRDDLYQMYAYARHLNCARVLLLYPGTTPTSKVTATRGEPLSVTAASLDLSRNWRDHLPHLHEQLRDHLRGQGLNL